MLYLVPDHFKIGGYGPEVEDIPQDILQESDDDLLLSESEVLPENALSVPLQVLLKFIIVWQFCFKVSDAAIGLLLIFFQNFLKINEYMRILGSKKDKCLSDDCPCSYKALQHLDLERKVYTEYVVCPKCNAIFDYHDCIQVIDRKECSRVCHFIQFPNHPMRPFREQCGTQC